MHKEFYYSLPLLRSKAKEMGLSTSYRQKLDSEPPLENLNHSLQQTIYHVAKAVRQKPTSVP